MVDIYNLHNTQWAMVDTVALLLHHHEFVITQPDRFSPSARLILEHTFWGINSIRAKQNPTKQELRSGIYKPRLTLFKRINPHEHPEPLLKIEVSLPKLLLGNNFNELRYKDFDAIIHTLVGALQQMGVIVSPEKLANASVSAIHYSKNILLTDGSTPHYFISKIKEANITLALDINQTDYRNEGHSYKWHCNAYEVVFYDKIRDLEAAKKSSKRSLEQDNELQLNLCDTLRHRHNLELLRMEVRLSKKQKLKALFKKLEIHAELTLKKLFKPAISKKVLLHYIDELESKRPPLLDYTAANDKALLATLLFNNPTLKPRQLLHVFGLKKILETVPLRELRVMFAKHQQRTWYRLITDLNSVTVPLPEQPLQIIRQQIMAGKPVQLMHVHNAHKNRKQITTPPRNHT